LKYFNQNGEKITFNSAGTIFIDQVALPSSNIFEIFPILFKRKNLKRRIPGLNDFLEKLQELGLNHLVLLNKITTKTNQNQKKNLEDHGLKNEASNYWYLG
jgi:hypothetical protein